MLCAIAALYIANSQWNDAYHHILEMPFTIGVEGFQLSKSLHHWINDGLTALFFFVIGLELKREILVGELADPRHAMFPIIAELGFAHHPQDLLMAKTGILLASALAGVSGFLWLYFTSEKNAE